MSSVFKMFFIVVLMMVVFFMLNGCEVIRVSLNLFFFLKVGLDYVLKLSNFICLVSIIYM